MIGIRGHPFLLPIYVDPESNKFTGVNQVRQQEKELGDDGWHRLKSQEMFTGHLVVMGFRTSDFDSSRWRNSLRKFMFFGMSTFKQFLPDLLGHFRNFRVGVSGTMGRESVERLDRFQRWPTETFVAQQVSVDLRRSPYYRETKDVPMHESTPLASLWGKNILKKWCWVKMYASRRGEMESSICRSRNTGVTDPVHHGFLGPVRDRFRFLRVPNSYCLFLLFFSILGSKNFTFQKYFFF